MNRIKTFVLLALLFTAGKSYSQVNPVYICRIDDKNNIILEDHITRTKNFEKNPDDPYYYDKYSQSFVQYLKSSGTYKENQGEYFFSKNIKEFEKYTDIKIGDLFYLSTPVNVYNVKVTGYKIIPDDEIGGGNIFYIVTENPEPGILLEGGMCIASKYPEMRTLDTTGTSDNSVFEMFRDIILKLTISEKKINYDEITPTESIKIFEGKYIEDLRMMPRAAKQYLVSYVKRTSFDSYTSLICVYDDAGILLKEVSPIQIDNFEFRNVLGVTDINSDGYNEILTESGYYEGWGSELFGFDGENFIKIADGFFFGV